MLGFIKYMLGDTTTIMWLIIAFVMWQILNYLEETGE